MNLTFINVKTKEYKNIIWRRVILSKTGFKIKILK